MDAATALTMEFVRNLGKTIRTLRAYSPQHRQSQAALAEAYHSLGRLLEVNPSVLLGTKEGSLVLQGKPLHDTTPAAQGFCEMLSSRHIATVAIEKGATLQEFSHLVKILSMSPEDLLESNAIRPEHLKPLQRIRVNELRFVAVQEGTPEGEAALLGGGGGREDLSVFINALLSGRSGAVGAGTAGGGGALPLQSLGAAMKSLMGSPGEKEVIQVAARHFDQIVEQCLADVPASRFIEEYLKGVAALPESVKRAVLQATGVREGAGEAEAMIERLPLAMRGRIVAEDLRRGATEPTRLRSILQRLAMSPAEYVQLVEIVSRLITEGASSDAEAKRKASEVNDLLPLAGERRLRRPSVMLVVRDREALASYSLALEEAGFAVTACRRPDPNLEAVLRARVVDALVMDIGPYRGSRLAFLGEIRKASPSAPLVLIEDVLTMRDPSEMEFCSQGTVLYKPLEPQKLAQTLQEMVPAPAEKLPPPPPSEEIESARQIQRELVPRELPVIPGYSLAARREPGSAQEGSYHDVLALPGRRFGLFVMDVAGNRAAALLSLLAARSSLQSLFLSAETPVQVLVGMNDLLVDSIPRGAFARAVGAVLDPSTGRLAVAAGGHPRPLRWHPQVPGVRFLQTAGAPLGLWKGPDFERTLRPVAVTLGPGDHVLFYTQGIVYAADEKGEELDERRIARAARAAPAGPAGLALVEVLEAVFQDPGDALEEDFTLLELSREALSEEAAGS